MVFLHFPPEAMGFRLLKEVGYSGQLRSDLPKKITPKIQKRAEKPSQWMAFPLF